MSYLVLLFMCISLVGQGIRSISNLTDYMGCYKSYILEAQNRSYLPKNNSRISCKAFCKQQPYRYAGTHDGTKCLCGVILNTFTVPYEECNKTCPMYKDETCGGRKTVQVYDTWPCRNEAWCNGSRCEDIDGIEYRCKCKPDWTGKHCTEIMTTEPSTTRTTILTTIRLIINISSTIVGQDTDAMTTLEHTTDTDINFEVISQKDKRWLIIGILVAVGMFVINGIFLTAWCVCRRTANQDAESDSDDKSTVNTISHNRSCVELEEIQTSREEMMCTENDEVNMYDCIDDATLYETIDK